MVRPRRGRRVSVKFESDFFKPANIRLKDLAQVNLFHEEIEAVRLKDFLGIEQKEAAMKMGVSQSTFHRILVEARKKIADALINGKAIKIEGGNFIMDEKGKKYSKIAISTSSKDIEGEIDARFGRCDFFLIVILDGKKIDKVETIENIHNQVKGGAGIAVAQMLANSGVDAIITENVGPRALEILNQFQIKVFKAQGPVKKAIQDFIDKNL